MLSSLLSQWHFPLGTYAARCSLGFKIISFDNSVWLFPPGCARLIDTDYFLLTVNQSGLRMTLLGFPPFLCDLQQSWSQLLSNTFINELMLPFWVYSCNLIMKLLTVLEVNGLQMTIQQGVYIYKSPGSHHYGLYLINKIIFPNKQNT